MACNNDNNSGFRLVPFMQNKSNSLSFFLASPYHDKPVVNFVIDIQDYTQQDAFFDILTVAVDSMILGKPPVGRDS